MDVYIWGDLEFADFVLKGIAAIFATSDGGFNIAAAILLVLFFMWCFIKWSLNPDKTTYPVREFVFGIVFWLIFGGGDLSPKFDVTLISERTGQATTVGEVPLLAAMPSWLATNFFRQITIIIDDYFIIPGYENLRNDQSGSDPLATLVKVSELANTRLVDSYVDRTVKDYIKFCYDMRLKLTGATFDKNISDLLDARMDGDLWAALYVDMELLETFIHTKDSTVDATCPQAHTHIANQLTPPSATLPLGGEFANKAMGIIQDAGIKPIDIKMGAELINAHLVSGPTVDPYTFSVNLFLATSIKDGVNQSSMQTWADKMVFEASRKRTYEAAGDRSLFMKIYIPTITAIEMFSFFIAPVLMILSVLGGLGFSLIGKYLMLVLFINLWGFVKVFVDLYTALSIRRAFQSASGGTGTPFDFQNYSQNFNDIESLLGIASNLTVAIPFFAMFLLYGGVHSVMGVMRTLTNGSTDGSNSAPTLASTMNNGTMQQADTTSTYVLSGGNFSQAQNVGTNQVYGTNTVNSGLSNVGANTSALVNQRVDQATTQYTDSVSDMASFVRSSLNTQSSGTTDSSGNTASKSDLTSIIDANTAGVTQNSSASAKIASTVAAALGVKAAVGEKTDTKADDLPKQMTGSRNDVRSALASFGLDASVSGRIAADMTDAELKQFAQTYNTTKQDATTRMSQGSYSVQNANSDLDAFSKTITGSDAFTRLNSSGVAVVNAETAQATLNNTLSNSNGLTQGNTLQFHTLGAYQNQQFTSWYNGLDETSQQRIAELGLGKGPTEVAASLHKNDPRYANDGAYMAQGLLTKLNANDTDLNSVGIDSGIAASLYRSMANHAAPQYQPAFLQAANLSEDFAKTATIITAGKKEIGDAPDVTKAQRENVDAAITNGQAVIPELKSKVNSELAQQNADASLQGADKKPINISTNTGQVDGHLTPDEVKALTRTGQGNEETFKSINEFGSAANKTLGSVIAGVQNIADIFGGRDPIYGQTVNEQAHGVSSFLARTQGIQSNQLDQGLQELANKSPTLVPSLFEDLKNGDASERFRAASQISRMMDASILLNTQEGATAMGKAFSSEDIARMSHNDGLIRNELAQLKSSDTPLTQNVFETLSKSRLNGSLTDDNVDTTLKLLTSSAQDRDLSSFVPKDGDVNSTQALSYMLFSSNSPFSQTQDGQLIQQAIQNHKTPEDVMSSSDFIERVAPLNKVDSYANTARTNIINDASSSTVLAGNMDQHGNFVTGYNFDENNQNKAAAVGMYVGSLVSSNENVGTFNAQQLNNATGGSESKGSIHEIARFIGGFPTDADKIDQQERLFTVATTPHNHAQRLEQAGFTEDATRVREGVDNLLLQGQQDYNLIFTGDQISGAAKTPEQLKELPTISEKIK